VIFDGIEKIHYTMQNFFEELDQNIFGRNNNENGI